MTDLNTRPPPIHLLAIGRRAYTAKVRVSDYEHHTRLSIAQESYEVGWKEACAALVDIVAGLAGKSTAALTMEDPWDTSNHVLAEEYDRVFGGPPETTGFLQPAEDVPVQPKAWVGSIQAHTALVRAAEALAPFAGRAPKDGRWFFKRVSPHPPQEYGEAKLALDLINHALGRRA